MKFAEFGVSTVCLLSTMYASGRVDQRDVDPIVLWFGSLSLPSSIGKPFVAVDVTSVLGNDYREFERGFLMEESMSEFLVYTQSLRVVRFVKNQDTPRGSLKVTYRQLALSDVARSIPDALNRDVETRNQYDGPIPSPAYDRFDLDKRVIIGHMAYRCHEHGLLTEADKLVETLKGLSIDHRHTDMVKHIVELAGSDLMRRAIWDMRVSPRQELLHRYEWLVQHFGEYHDAGRCKKMIPVLREMVAEEAKHGRSVAPNETEAERIERLVFQLRDQEGMAGDYLYRETVQLLNGPATELERLGAKVVPRLIEAVDDDRPCRIVVQWYRDGILHPVTIGHCAYRIVCDIGGPQVPNWGIFNIDELTKQERGDFKVTLRRWWSQARRDQ
jgi:hypothetical protein